MEGIKNWRVIYKIITIIVLIALIIGAVFLKLRLAGEGDTIIKDNLLNGQIIAANDQSLSIRDDSNVVYTVDLKDSKIVGDRIQFGNQAMIQYTGTLNQDISVQDIDVLKLTVQATQVRNGGIKNTDATTASKLLADKVAKMSLEDKVAQMFIAITPSKGAVGLLNQYSLGGYLLEDKDFKNKSRETVIANIKSYQDAVTIPLLIMVNEEGEDTVSVSNNLRNDRFRLPQDVFNSGGMDAIIADVTEKSEFLQGFGINVNLGPVADISDDETSFIYKRSFGGDVSETSEYVKNVVKSMNSLKMGSVLKYFPGYGNTPNNPDVIYHDIRDYNSFNNNDFKPFKAGFEAGANAVLINHSVIDAVDSQNPAALSSGVIKILRNDLKYNGVVIADDIAGAIPTAFGSDSEVAIKALQAGNDMIITSNPQEHINALIQAAQNNQISLNKLDQSIMRILTWKSQLGIL